MNTLYITPHITKRLLVIALLYTTMLTAVLTTLIPTTPIFAQEPERPHLDIGLGLSHDDNINKSQSNPESDMIVNSFANLQFQSSDEYYQLSLDYGSLYESYSQNTFEDTLTTTGTGRLTLGSRTSILQWHASHTEEEVATDVNAPRNPDFLTQRTTFSTGPSINLKISQADRLQLRHTLLKTNIQGSPADRESESSTFLWVRQSSKKLRLSLGGELNTIEPDTSDEYDQSRVHVMLDRTINGGNIQLKAGQTRIERPTGNDIDDDEYQLNIRYKQLSLLADRTVSDSSAAALQGPLTSIEDIASNDFRLIKKETRSANYTLPTFYYGTTLNLNFARIENVDLSDSSSQSTENTSVSLNKPFGERYRVGVDVGYSENTVKDINQRSLSRQTRYGLSFGYRASQTTDLSCRVQRLRSKSDSGDLRYQSELASCDFRYRVF